MRSRSCAFSRLRSAGKPMRLVDRFAEGTALGEEQNLRGRCGRVDFFELSKSIGSEGSRGNSASVCEL